MSKLSRREALATAAGGVAAAAVLPKSGRLCIGAETERDFAVHAWRRDERNPVLPPSASGFDVGCCMNPFVLRRGDEYWLYYAGADKAGRRRICLATTPVDDLTGWKRRGPLFDPGSKGAFDEMWCVLPCVHRVGDRWHLYYTGRSTQSGLGLQAFHGIGLVCRHR